MMIRAITAALLLCGAACADSSDEPVPDTPVEEDGDPTVTDPDPEGFAAQGAPFCEVPADAEGACALACDADAVIEQYVPEGTCTIFECPHADGSSIRTGGCNL